MTVVTNAREIFKAVPSGKSITSNVVCLTSNTDNIILGHPEPGKTTVCDYSEKIDLDDCPLNGGFLIKCLYLSIEPVIRGRVREPGSQPGPVSS